MGLEIINIIKKRKGITNEELSTMSGIPKGTIDKITAGTTKDPKLETLKAIAKVLECSLNDFDQVEPTPERLSEDKQKLLRSYDLLNDEGKIAACDSVEALTYMPKYKKSDKSQFFTDMDA